MQPYLKDSKRESLEDWEIPSSEVSLERKIGSGSFGTVFMGRWFGKATFAYPRLSGIWGVISQCETIFAGLPGTLLVWDRAGVGNRMLRSMEANMCVSLQGRWP